MGPGGRSDHDTPLLSGEGALPASSRPAGCGLWPAQWRYQGHWKITPFFKNGLKCFFLCLRGDGKAVNLRGPFSGQSGVRDPERLLTLKIESTRNRPALPKVKAHLGSSQSTAGST